MTDPLSDPITDPAPAMPAAAPMTAPERPQKGAVTWHGVPDAIPPRPNGVLAWARVIRRGLGLLLVLVLGVLILLPLRGGERLFTGARRPLSGPWVQGVCRAALWVMGIGWCRKGRPMQGPGAVVANHVSWLDIFVLNAAMPVFFVSKAEVAGWPGINILTRVTNTHFVVRDPKHARQQAEEFAQRVRSGHRLLFFPEGTSSDGRRVLAFKPTLFQGFLDPALPAGLQVQPVTSRYIAPAGQAASFYGWWGDMAMGPHLLSVLTQRHQGRVEVILHPPLPVAGQTRKTLAAQAEAAVRAGLDLS